MLYDLNIAWSPSTTTAELERTLRFSSQLGYNVVALNHTLDAPLPSKLANPLPRFPTPPSPPQPQNTTTTTTTTGRLPTILHRITIAFTDPSQNPQLAKAAQAYDLVAVRPQSEKAFQAACLTVQDASLISLDLSTRQPFYFRPKPCMAAVSRGLRFEICYSRAILASPGSGGGGVDARARANFAGNVAQLVRATRGRGIVISSEAGAAMGLRAPADVVNLLAVWGLSPERGMEGLRANPRGVVVNEGIKRSGFRGVVDIVGVAERSAEEEKKKGGAVGVGEGRGVVPVNKDSKKRKNGDAEGGDAQPVSKRQAKKLKAALRRKEVEGKEPQS